MRFEKKIAIVKQKINFKNLDEKNITNISIEEESKFESFSYKNWSHAFYYLIPLKIYNSNTTLRTYSYSGNIISDNFNYNGEVDIFNYKEPTYLIYNTKASAVEIGSISNILTRIFMDYGN